MAGFEASFEAGLKGLKPMEIGAKQYCMTKKGPFFGPLNVTKSRRAKMDLPRQAVSCTSLPVSFNVSVCEHFIFGMQKLSPSFPVDNMQRFPEKYVDNICAAKAE